MDQLNGVDDLIHGSMYSASRLDYHNTNSYKDSAGAFFLHDGRQNGTESVTGQLNLGT